jgi:hypothetical protein
MKVLDLKIDSLYKFKYDENIFRYVGYNLSGNGVWHQFTKDVNHDVCVELLDSDIELIEPYYDSVSIGTRTSTREYFVFKNDQQHMKKENQNFDTYISMHKPKWPVPRKNKKARFAKG